MADGINWGVADPGSAGYGAAAPKDISSLLATLGQPQQQQRQGQGQQQPGAPLNISPKGPGGPSWFDRLRDYFSGGNTGPAPVNPNPPSPTDVGGGPTPGSVDDFTSRFYYTPRQAGGPVGPSNVVAPNVFAGGGQGVPGYAGRLVNAMGAAPSGVAPQFQPPPMPPAGAMPMNMAPGGMPPPGMPPGAPGMPPGGPAGMPPGAGPGMPPPGTPVNAQRFPMAAPMLNRFQPPPGYMAGAGPAGG
jgi:hypothetical protein